MFYTRRSTLRFISCNGHQLYAFKGHGVDHEIEGIRYIDIHRGPHTYWAGSLHSRGGDLELEGGVNVSL